MSLHEAPGLAADWLNGWLAAIGVTALVPGVRLSWTEGGTPHAVFYTDQQPNLAEAIAEALPTPGSLSNLPIARTLPTAHHEFGRRVSLATFRERAGVERNLSSGVLAASASDLSANAKLGELEHGPFDPPVPADRTLWQRAFTCAEAVMGKGLSGRVWDTLSGYGERQRLNGLGFDARRLPGGTHPVGDSGVYVDPIIELLAFGALPLFPVRGNGTRIRQRLWTASNTKRGSFEWIAWAPALDRWGIDALLDQLPRVINGLTIAKYQVVPYYSSRRS